MKETTIHQRFRSRIYFLRQHLEMVSLSLSESASNFDRAQKTNSNVTITQALGASDDEYKKLATLPVREQRKFIQHSKNRNYENVLQLLYAHIEEYSYAIAEKLPKRLNAYKEQEALQDRSITAKELLEAHKNSESLDKILATIITQQIQACESGRKILDQIEKKTNIKKPEQKKKSNALFLLDVRNNLVHDAGKSNQKILEKWRTNLDVHLQISKPGQKIKLTRIFIENGIQWICDYVYDIDEHLIDAGIVTARPLPKNPANSI